MPRPPTHERKPAVLEGIRMTGRLKDGCKAAEVSYQTLFNWRHNDPEFAAAVEQALRDSALVLEEEARRRAIEGLRKYRFTKDGEPIAHPVTGEPYYEEVYSDSLLAILLKANNPSKFAIPETTINTGSTAVQVYLPENSRDTPSTANPE
jgi:hypothetical protein